MQKIYWCWATTEGISSWFLKNAQYEAQNRQIRKPDEHIQKGDAYIWEWYNWDGKEKGKVLKANGVDFLELTFASPSKVSITLEDNVTSVLLTLKQYNIPTDEENKLAIHHGCSNGWAFWLTNLKAYLEHNILLNETEIDLREVPLAGFQFVNM